MITLNITADMDQKLIKQVKNEWRSNIWLVVELAVISVVLWYIVDYLFVTGSVYNQPRGFDISHCYRISTGELLENHPDYDPDRKGEKLYQDYEELRRRIEMRPEVESAALSMNSTPYNGSNSGVRYLVDSILSEGYVIHRRVSPDFPKVFRWRGMKGETPEELSEILKRGEVLVSDNLLHFSTDNPRPMTEYVGRRIVLDMDTANPVRVGASIVPVRYNDYMQGQINRTVVTGIPRSYFNVGGEFSVRVKGNMDEGFIESIMADADSQLRSGNLFITDVESFDDIREAHQYGTKTQIRNMIFIIGFLLVNIFLGLLGTFWFRTRQRSRDIAIRLVSGATKGDIFRLLISEGLVLLTIATPVALFADLNIAHAELNQYYEGEYLEWGRLLICGGVTYLLIALMIALGISIPAWRAMKIDPAVALRDE